MTLHIFFFTITIKLREYSPEELISLVQTRQITEKDNKIRFNYYRPF
ncbi:YrzI family small protein [Bacillus sp. FJAT-18017]|nr:YrzI family small protein [Bacillus sp. FJAT-18017]